MIVDDTRRDFSKRLNQALDNIGYPPKGSGRQVQLAKDFSVSQKGARKWLEGESMPSMTRLSELASRLGVSTEWLMSGRGEIGVNEGQPRYSPDVVMLDENKLITYIEAKYTPSQEDKRICCPVSHSPEAFVTQLHDLSAIPEYSMDEWLWVDRKFEVKPGIHALIDMQGDFSVRRIVVEKKKLYGMAFNPAWPSGAIEIDLDEIVGKVIFSGKPR